MAQDYEINDAHDGEKALERMRNERFDLVLLDVNMPGIGGIETCRSLRVGSDAPILILTVRDREQDKAQALVFGHRGQREYKMNLLSLADLYIFYG